MEANWKQIGSKSLKKLEANWKQKFEKKLEANWKQIGSKSLKNNWKQIGSKSLKKIENKIGSKLEAREASINLISNVIYLLPFDFFSKIVYAFLLVV